MQDLEVQGCRISCCLRLDIHFRGGGGGRGWADGGREGKGGGGGGLHSTKRLKVYGYIYIQY